MEIDPTHSLNPEPFILQDPEIVAVFEKEYDNLPTLEDPSMLRAFELADGDPNVARKIYAEFRHSIDAMALVAKRQLLGREDSELCYGIADVAMNRIMDAIDPQGE